MNFIRTKFTNFRQLALDLLLPINYNGRLRDPDSKATRIGKRWGTTVDREEWDDYRNGKGDRLY